MTKLMTRFGTYISEPILAELYDYVPGYSKRADIEFYINYCNKPDEKILELGSGTGRITLPIADTGAEITGLDFSQNMLDRCAEKLKSRPDEIQKKVRFVCGDMIDFDFDQKFDRVIIPFRAFQHIVEVEDQLACLKCINKCLKPNGKLAFDIFQVATDKLNNPELFSEVEDFAEYELPDGRKLSRAHRIALFQRYCQVNSVELIYYLTKTDDTTERIVHKFPMRYFFRYEIEHLLARCGFKLKMIFGDFDKSPLADSSPEMIFMAEKIEEL